VSAISRRVAVISDIHANSLALDAVLAAVSRTGFDQLVIAGDLLTYGPAPHGVIERVSESLAKYSASLLLGNHDLFYIASDTPEDLGELGQPWIAESIAWTRQQNDVGESMTRLPWRSNLIAQDLLFSHANPFGDWTYLQNHASLERAQQTLATSGFALGVFGHTHRSSIFPRLNGLSTVTIPRRHDGDVGQVVTVGSVGQPRGGPPVAEFLLVDVAKDTLTLHFDAAVYDVDRHLGDLRISGLTEGTVAQIEQFFR
jgi:predicted phosphodiesterase